ncbi:phosphatase PAP2 family protein [Rhodocytophaga rosea]
MRPEYIFENGLTGAHYWFKSGDGFPSGHASYYFSLFFPPCYYFDKAKPVIIIPVMIAVGRVIQKAHFLSDIVMSVLIVVTLTVAADLIIRMAARHIKLKAFY